MAEFYDHPHTGKLHFRALAGGHGGGATSEFDAPARPEDIAAFHNAHAAYVRKKHLAAQQNATAAEKEAALEKLDDAVAAVDHAVHGDEPSA